MHINPSGIINAFADRRILVIGDAMLDSYLMGDAHRLCAEAPVPVVALSDRQDIPGGAANTAVNLRSLGADVVFLSVIGDDHEGKLLQQALEQHGIATETVLAQTHRQTLVKQRVMAAAQMLVRLDQGSTDAIAPEPEQQLIHHLNHFFSQCDAIVISDYGYGILTPRVIQAIGQFQAHSPRLLVADSKRLAAYRSIGVTVVKPNYEEAMRLLAAHNHEQAVVDGDMSTRADRIAQNSHQLLETTGASIVATTLDAEGALILQRHEAPYRLYATTTKCVNTTTGAGDTFISAFTLALAAGATVLIAAELAMTAAAIVVAKAGTAMCSASELQALNLSQRHDRKALDDDVSRELMNSFSV